MFSYNLQKTEPCEYSFLLRVLEGQTASGYLVNENYYDTLINLYEEAIPLLESTESIGFMQMTKYGKKLQILDTWYCFRNRLGKQRDGFSDISQVYVKCYW